MLLTGHKAPIKIPSGPTMTAKDDGAARSKGDARMAVRGRLDWLPGPGAPRQAGERAEESRRAAGSASISGERSAARSRSINDAAMQALGSYRGGRMLFLGLGTGLGSALIIDGVLEPMELAHLPYKKGRTYEEYVGTGRTEAPGQEEVAPPRRRRRDRD